MNSTPYRSEIQAVTNTLLSMHRTLIYATRTAYERETNERLDPYAVLRHLADNPAFAWLQPVTALLADLDALLAQPAISAVDAAAVRLEISALIDPAADGPDSFYAHLMTARQLAPDLIVTHAHLRAALATLPQPETETLAVVRQARSTWHARRQRPASQ